MPSLQDGGVGWGRGSTGCTRGSFENAGDGGGRVGGRGRPRYSGSPTPPTTQRVPACPRGPRSGDPHYFLPRVEKKKRMKVEVHIC
jgi:hypothetical protein